MSLGRWFTAGFDSECNGCGDRICEGEQARADGDGGYLCENCGEAPEDSEWENLGIY